MILEGRRLLVTGVMTRESIAYAVAERAQRLGAEVVLTSFGRQRRLTERAAQGLPAPADVLELDITSEADVEAARAALDERWGALDGILHAIAFAPADALGGNFLHTPVESATKAFEVSAFSLKTLSEGLLPLLERSGRASVVGLDFDASRAWPVYDWMGVAKAALEAVGRYLARDLGPSGIRVNLVASGPLRTVAARGIPGFDLLADTWRAGAPLGWDTRDPGPVADAVCFLLSDLSRAMTGEILHVDGGLRAVACGLAPDPTATEEELVA